MLLQYYIPPAHIFYKLEQIYLPFLLTEIEIFSTRGLAPKLQQIVTNFATSFVLPNSTPFDIIRTFVHTLLTVPDPRSSYRKAKCYFTTLPQYLLPVITYLFFERPQHYRTKRHHHDHILDALGSQFLLAVHGLPDAPATHDI